MLYTYDTYDTPGCDNHLEYLQYAWLKSLIYFNLLGYYRLLTNRFIKQKISSLNNLEGLFVK